MRILGQNCTEKHRDGPGSDSEPGSQVKLDGVLLESAALLDQMRGNAALKCFYCENNQIYKVFVLFY